MQAQPLAPLDAGWLLVESDVAHTHVGTVAVLQPPTGADEGYVRRFVEWLRGYSTPTAPFDRRIVRSGIGRIWPLAERVDELDTEHHVRHEALPRPGTRDELNTLVSWLHSTPLDMSEPPWELHVIEGLEDGRFAVYVKLHHSLMDGVGAVRLVESALSTDPGHDDTPPLWAARESHPAPPTAARSLPSLTGLAKSAGWAVDQAAAGLTATRAALRTFVGDGVPFLSRTRSDLTRAYRAPTSVLNDSVTTRRRLATCSFDTSRVRETAKRLDVTINDLVLAVCSGGLRRYLAELDALPDEPLVAGLPLSVRPTDSDNTGSAISFALAGLATDVADPGERLAAITASATEAKHHLSSMPKDAVDLYTVMLLAPVGLTQMTGVGHAGTPIFNLVVSNVAGPTRPLYFGGARVDELDPVSVVLHGQALNITAFSYADRFALSFTACRDRLPDLPRLARACSDEFDALETELL